MLSPVISAFNESLIDAGIGLPIAWENSTPPDVSGPWLAAFFVPATTSGASLGDAGMDQTDGFLQIDVNTETGKGWSGLHGYADQLQQHFRLGRLLTYAGKSVQVTGSGRSGGRVEGGWYRLSLTINWIAYTQRN